jgi:hypothetical protein
VPKRRFDEPVILFAAIFFAATVACMGCVSSALAEPTSDDKLRQFMERQVGGNAARAAAKVSSELLQERSEMIEKGEAALAALQLEPALLAFERAANILHAADTEIALVRTYMQYGQYRRALAAGAHTAGAHLDVVGGSALYAWLLHMGAQTAVAQRLLTQAQARMPGDTKLERVRQQLDGGRPLAAGDLLNPPTRLAPYSVTLGLPATARVVGSAVLLPGGTQALVPLSLLPKRAERAKLWLRNGLGLLVEGAVVKRLPAAGVALVTLSQPLPVPDDFWIGDKEPFPGSPGYAVEYVASPKTAKDAAPAWPVLHLGFLGARVTPTGTDRLLGIDMPVGPRGGPVFGTAGQLIGVALAGKPGTADQLVTASQLQTAMGQPPRGVMPKGALTPSTADRIYENGLKVSLQVIAVP